MEPFTGQIMQVGFSYAPQNWSTCQGQIMNVNQNGALFALLGTTYGGNGSTTFALPNAQGRTFVGTGQGQSNYVWGQVGGSENVTLASSQIPQHVHAVGAPNMTASLQAVSNNTAGDTLSAPEAGALLGAGFDSVTSAAVSIYVPAGTSGAVNLGGLQIAGNTGITGGGQPFSVVQPFLAVTTIIALNGIYPSRP